MVKLMIIGRNPTVRGWHDWRFDGEYDGYDTVGKAITACIEQQESHPEPWQWSITVVEFDCRVPEISFHPERLWLSELTYEERWGGVNATQLYFLGGFVIGSDNMIFGGSFTFAAAFGWPFARYAAWPFAWHAAAFLLSICFCYPHLDIGIGPNSVLA